MRPPDRAARWVLLGLAAGLVLLACSDEGPSPPPREQVLPLLEQEAAALKREGEDVDPDLGVEMEWRIEAVRLEERPGDGAHPWAGVVDVTIVSRIPELDGYITEETKKSFRYLWESETSRWVME